MQSSSQQHQIDDAHLLECATAHATGKPLKFKATRLGRPLSKSPLLLTEDFLSENITASGGVDVSAIMPGNVDLVPPRVPISIQQNMVCLDS